jgi:hypothetical protein
MKILQPGSYEISQFILQNTTGMNSVTPPDDPSGLKKLVQDQDQSQ